MAQHDFKIGDVVRLKSGSPSMVVNFLQSATSLKVMWFANDAMHESWASPAVLDRCAGGGGGSRRA